MQGYKHLIECHCVLPQFRNKIDVVYHKFTAFSIIDDNDTVVSSLAQCNSCGTIHKIIDICKSEIMTGKDESRAVELKEDISMSLPSSLVELFANYKLDLPDYQHARFILENKMWDATIVLTVDAEGDQQEGKVLRFISEERFRVEPFSRTESV
tara:strand:- start:611 stop:1072 length:462 start_codon:yes stop_codon:yes gene_type:complete